MLSSCIQNEGYLFPSYNKSPDEKKLCKMVVPGAGEGWGVGTATIWLTPQQWTSNTVSGADMVCLRPSKECQDFV